MKERINMRLNKTSAAIFATLFLLTSLCVFAQTPLNQFSIIFENSSTATMVGQDGLVMRTEDGGLNWTVLDAGITNVLFSNESFVYFDPAGTLQSVHFACGENGVIIKSVNSGANWSLLTTGTTENLNYIITRKSDEMYACGNNGTLLFSQDLGETWSPINVNSTENLKMMAIAPDLPEINKRMPVIVGNNGTVLVNTDLAGTWLPVVCGTTTNLNAVVFGDEQVVIAAGNNGEIIKSIDGGLTWIAVNSGTSLNIFSVKYIRNENKQDLIASAENGLILISNDMGDNWQLVQTPTTNDLYSVSFGNSEFGITTGEAGTELYSNDGGLTWTENPPGDRINTVKNDQAKLNQNYPNPFNPTTVISYAVNDNSNVNIKIYDMTGREVKTLVNSYHTAGTYSVNFNASNLASGIYFYVLRVNTGANEITKTMKMILTK